MNGQATDNDVLIFVAAIIPTIFLYILIGGFTHRAAVYLKFSCEDEDEAIMLLFWPVAVLSFVFVFFPFKAALKLSKISFRKSNNNLPKANIHNS